MSSEIVSRGVKIAGEVGSRAVGNGWRVRWKEDEIKRDEKGGGGGGRIGGGAVRCREVDGKEEAPAEETRVLLGGRTKGGWVLSRFALHALELCAEVAGQERRGSSSLFCESCLLRARS